MKVKKLEIKNIGKIKGEMIELNKPLIIFYGEILQGKTTILNCVRWVMGGGFPEDIIRHGEKNGRILLELDNGSISREFYKAKDGITVARPITFVRDGKPVKKPVDEIKKVLNPFLLDQDHLRKMTETERRGYFVEIFGVDTAEIDQQYTKAESEAKDLRAKIKGYGEIDLTEIKSIDILPLKDELTRIKVNYGATIREIDTENRKVIEHNNQVLNAEADIQEWDKEIKELEEKLSDTLKWLSNNSRKIEIQKPDPPDTSIIESEIAEAAGNQVRYEQYRKNLKRAEERSADEKRVSELESKQRELKKQKIAKLAKIGETSGIKTLTFDETGTFIYEGTSAGMLSGSQIMKLSEELSSLYPKDLGISLIDRGESLGKSVFLLIDRAKEEEKTILATVVGEKPANIPEEIGVFIVEEGEIKP
ncbi:MAG: hypothetical protein DDT33_00989 [Firmicutes bacterium]|nr:hypothetical protein [Bacillota bacterium]